MPRETKKTNFDRYLEKQLADPEFAARFEHAGEAWDVTLQMRRQARLSQKIVIKSSVAPLPSLLSH